MKYAFVAEHRPTFSVRRMCHCLNIHPSGFYAWIKNPLSHRAREDARQTKLLKEAWNDSGKVYGYRKLHDDLVEQGEVSCPNRIARLTRLAGIRAQIGYKRKPGKYGGKPSVVVDNALDRQFDVAVPDTAWVSDITYIKTYEGFLYLAVVSDLYSRRVIGWATQSRQPTDLVLQALLMAVWRRKPKQTVLIHTDQGSQYTSRDWAAFLRAHNLEHSMSRRGIAMTMQLPRASSTCSNANEFVVGHTKPASRPDRTSSTTSKCSITRNANMSETVCCRPSTSKTDSVM